MEDLTDMVVARFLVAMGVPDGDLKAGSGSLLGRGELYTAYNNYVNPLPAAPAVGHADPHQLALQTQGDQFGPASLPGPKINEVLTTFFLSTNGTRAERVGRLREFGASLSNNGAPKDLGPGRQLVFKSSLNALNNKTQFKALEKEVLEKAAILMVKDDLVAEYKNGVARPANFDKRKKRDYDVLYSACADVLSKSARRSWDLHVEAGNSTGDLVDLLLFLKEKAESLGPALETIDSKKFSDLSWDKQKGTFGQFGADVRDAAMKIPEIVGAPGSVQLENAIRTKLIANVATTDPTIQNLVDSIKMKSVQDQGGTVVHMVNELEKRFAQHSTDGEQQCQMYAVKFSSGSLRLAAGTCSSDDGNSRNHKRTPLRLLVSPLTSPRIPPRASSCAREVPRDMRMSTMCSRTAVCSQGSTGSHAQDLYYFTL